VTNRAAAHRYARALFDVALKERVDLPAVEERLADFTRLFSEHAGLAQALLNPAVPAPRKRAVVDQLVTRAAVPAVLAKLLLLLAERDRLVLLPDLLAAFRDRLLDHLRVVRAEVASAAPLDAARAKTIEASLERATGRRVQLTTRVQPELVGGLVARVGGTVYDASVTTQLRKMRQRLVESM
jgi:F-type H+-transporting ATPase subunit delta